jgi:hypothetical protein
MLVSSESRPTPIMRIELCGKLDCMSIGKEGRFLPIQLKIGRKKMERNPHSEFHILPLP